MMKLITAQSGVQADYFVSEFIKYAGLMTNNGIEITVEHIQPEEIKTKSDKCIKLALLSDLNLPMEDLQDPFIEDIIDINVNCGNGYIAGSNVRSILMGVYKFFFSAGCRFLRPGTDGEYIPLCDIENHSFRYRKKADHPFRGECCEGAISYEHMRDTVYWLPKVGMNMYMIEGLVPYTYMHKWYGHIGNTVLRQKGQVTDYQFLEEKIALLEQDIIKTGVQLHSMGHGWMFEKFGVHHGPSFQEKEALKEEYKQYLAQVKGVRDLYGGSTFYTHFCYSNPEARKVLVDFVVEYVQQKPYIDFLHLWLADAANNWCECDECQKLLPSDYYVQLLNEIDEALEKIGAKTRLVFIIYVETVRPPKQLRLKHPERFLLVAAIGSEYENGYRVLEEVTEEQPYVLNTYSAPNEKQRQSWHRQWKKLCNNIPSCIFEYRFYLDQYCDMGHMRLTKEVNRDMKALQSIDFQGCMSDQTHRCYMPTALPMLMMAETLFDTEVDYEAFCKDYFVSAFGSDGEQVQAYLEEVSVLCCPSNVRNNGNAHNGIEEVGIENQEGKPATWRNNPAVCKKLAQIPECVRSFLPVIERNMETISNPAIKRSWEYLKYHGEIIVMLSEILIESSIGTKEHAKELYMKLQQYLGEHEMEFHEVLDVFLFDRYVRMHVGLPNVAYYD